MIFTRLMKRPRCVVGERGVCGVAVVTACFGSQRAFPSWAILVFPLDPKAEGTPIAEMSELTHGVQMVQPVSDRSPRTHSEAF